MQYIETGAAVAAAVATNGQFYLCRDEFPVEVLLTSKGHTMAVFSK